MQRGEGLASGRASFARVGLRLLHLGTVVQSGFDVRETARPRMHQLAIETGETAVLLVPAKAVAVCVEPEAGVDISLHLGWQGSLR